eukprot:366281-Chlamydomonas_euryale.AAC.23
MTVRSWSCRESTMRGGGGQAAPSTPGSLCTGIGWLDETAVWHVWRRVPALFRCTPFKAALRWSTACAANRGSGAHSACREQREWSTARAANKGSGSQRMQRASGAQGMQGAEQVEHNACREQRLNAASLARTP